SEGTFLAELVFEGRRVSARPSDAVAVALRTSSPVLVSREVLDEVGISLVEQGEEEVEAFREFLDQVNPDDFLGGGDAPREPGGRTS
ncbi:MAG: bifunctional nuclease domain-containing protein, partial [Dietzia sp.]|nr:bifunctional nuclease domain-containing protein [Dietzia sp.]